MTLKPDLSLIIACYNEEPLLEDSVRQVLAILACLNLTYEIIFVDDCSKDNTRQIIQKLIEKYPEKNLRALYHEINCGRGRTVSDGFLAATGSIVGYLDIDLETSARYIPSMVIAIQEGADIATAHRIYKLHPRLFVRFLLSQGYHRLVQLFLNLPLHDTETGYKFFRRDVALSLLDQVEDEHWFWDTEIMARAYWADYKINEIPCLFLKRYDKKSSVRVVKDTVEYFNQLWKFRQAMLVFQNPSKKLKVVNN
jgi:glycosyltransferase involved in cell wall biosynthesis